MSSLVDSFDDGDRYSSLPPSASFPSSSSSLMSSSFRSDAVSQSLGLSLSALNGPAPTTLAQANEQLAVAKRYIERVQKNNAAAAAASGKSSSFSNGGNNKQQQQQDERIPLSSSSGAGGAAASGSSSRKHSRAPSSHSHIVIDPFSYGGSEHNNMELADEDDGGLQASLHAPPPEMSPDDYYATPWWRLLLKRLPWLVVLLLLQSFGALILNHYDQLLSKHLVLNFFIPMMQGTSGNAGNQPGVMVTRALSLGKLRLAELLSKELPVALLMAFTLGVVAYFRILLVYPEDKGSAESIAIALFCSVVLAVTLSIIFSILLARITCCDPADGAVPLLSTVSDVISILLLVTIASALLPYPKDQ